MLKNTRKTYRIFERIPIGNGRWNRTIIADKISSLEECALEIFTRFKITFPTKQDLEEACYNFALHFDKEFCGVIGDHLIIVEDMAFDDDEIFKDFKNKIYSYPIESISAAYIEMSKNPTHFQERYIALCFSVLSAKKIIIHN